MNLLKIGTLNIPRNRWEDGLKVFNKIFVVCSECEQQLKNDNIVYYKMKHRNKINSFLSNVFFRICRKFRGNYFIVNLTISILRLLNQELILEIKKLEYSFVHSSYNDFDESGIITMMIYPIIKDKFLTRAYKENRPEKNYIEEFNFKIANRIVLNSLENKSYFINKHKDVDWDSKEVIIDLDEDYRQSKIINNVILDSKLSKDDVNKHIVILAGRVMSNDEDKRSGTRLYYIPLIKELIKAGLIVHLHTMKIINDEKGINQYEELRKNCANKFYIEKPLDFENNPSEAYKILSRYDYGILHNINQNDEYVSVFDKVNIPHRFYEYQIAEVIPVLKKDDTILMERIFKEKKCGVVYTKLDDLNKLENKNISFYKKTFYDYITSLYG